MGTTTPISILIENSITGETIDITNYITAGELVNGPNGFESLSLEITGAAWLINIAFSQLRGAAVTAFSISEVWEGRLEDVQMIRGGSTVALVALGNWRALTDPLITAVFTKADYTGFRAANATQRSSAGAERNYIEFNNRILLAPRKGELFGGSVNRALAVYRRPHGSITSIVRVTFDYEFNGSSNWSYNFQLIDDDYAFISSEFTRAGTGTLQTGSEDITLASAAPGIGFIIYYNASPAAVYTGETGDTYFKITNLKLFFKDDTTITARDILSEVVTTVNARNPEQLAATTIQIEDPGLNFDNLEYIDTRPSVIANELATYGDNNTPPRVWRAAVWEGRSLQFGPVEHEFIRVYSIAYNDNMTITQTTATGINRFYGVYKDANGDRRITDPATRDLDIETTGTERTAAVPVQTTSETAAEALRDAAANDALLAPSIGGIVVDQAVWKESGAIPLWDIRPGDIIEVRGVPEVIAGEAAGANSFKVLATRLNLITGLMEIIPDEYPRTLDQLVSRRNAGIYV